MASSPSTLNRTLKRWPGWLLLALAAAVLVLVGATRDGGSNDPDERAASLAQRVACPVCDGESVYESRNRASINLRNEITTLVNEGRLPDDQILARLERTYGEEILLVPRSDGVHVLVWALPAVAAVFGAAGLVVVFRRWRLAGGEHDPTEDDRALVSSALAAGNGDDR